MPESKNALAPQTVPNDVFGVAIFDGVTRKFVNLLKIALLESCAGTHLPEIFEIFGPDSFLKFLDVFSGCTIKVPPTKVLQDSIRDVSIYLLLKKVSPGSRVKVVRDLADRYGVTPGVVRRIFVEMEERLARYSIADNSETDE